MTNITIKRNSFFFLMCLVSLFLTLPEVKAQKLDDNKWPQTEKGSNHFQNFQYLVTSADTLFEEISESGTNWDIHNEPFFEHSFTSDAIWLKVALHSPPKNTTLHFLLDNNRLDYVDFYFVTDLSTVNVKSGRLHLEKSKHAISLPNAEFNLIKNVNANLYIRIQSDTHMSFGLKIFSSENFGRFVLQGQMVQVGFVLMILTYVLVQIRFNPTVLGRMEFYLIITVLANAGFILSIFGDLHQVLWPSSEFLKNNANYIFSMSSKFSFLLFLPHYLRATRRYLKFTQTCNYFAIAHIGLLLTMLILPSNFQKSVLDVSSTLSIFIAIAWGFVIAYHRRYRWVLILGYGWLVLALSIVIYIFQIFGILPYNFFTSNAIPIAFCIDVILMFYILFLRAKTLVKEQKLLRKKLQTVQKMLVERHSQSSQEKTSARLYTLDSTEILNNLMHHLMYDKPYLNGKISLTSVGQYLSIRPDQLSAIINQKLDCHFSDLINESRIQHACKIIRKSPEQKLFAVAIDCGFGSRASFNRVFKKVMNISPSDYRENVTKLV